MPDDRPNVLLFTTDPHRGDHASVSRIGPADRRALSWAMTIVTWYTSAAHGAEPFGALHRQIFSPSHGELGLETGGWEQAPLPFPSLCLARRRPVPCSGLCPTWATGNPSGLRGTSGAFHAAA